MKAKWRVVWGGVACALAIGVQLFAPPEDAPAPEQFEAVAVASSPAAPDDPVAVPVAPTPALDPERELFSQAEDLLFVEPSRSIELLRAADTRFPRGALADERQFLKLRARVNLEQIAEARVDATDYLELNPRSPLAPRIHQLLGIRAPHQLPFR